MVEEEFRIQESEFRSQNGLNAPLPLTGVRNKSIASYTTHALILSRDITQMRWLLLGLSGRGNCGSM
ncbi:hypothetical protein A4S05_20490 [Nostoc sp. KVJ20]|nr:hypothetical protein A4S05_20490 [Nostoc sp. KVJ20]